MSLILDAKISPRFWFMSKFYYSMSLLDSYVKGVEEQAKKSVELYENNKTEVVFEVDKNERNITSIEYYQGLTDDSWSLEDVFKDYFPSLQRKSALVTLFSLFESELNELCRIYQKTLSLEKCFKDINGSGIERAVEYLEKEATLQMQKDTREWQGIKNIQKIRNLIVHANSNLIDEDGNLKEHEYQYIT